MAHAKKHLQHALPIETLADGLWRITRALRFPPIPRNMFVYQLFDGSLLLHSVIAMDDAGMAALETLGRPTVMIVPHPRHWLDAQFYMERYPWLRVFGEPDAQAKLPSIRFDGRLAEGLPELGVKAYVVPGMKMHEVVLDVPLEGGRALLFTDLVNKTEGDPGLLLRLVGPPGDGGVAKILKLTQIADVEVVRTFLRQLADLPAIRLVSGCHGGIVRTQCGAWLRGVAESM